MSDQEKPRYFASKQGHMYWLVWDREGHCAAHHYMGAGARKLAEAKAAELNEQGEQK